MVLSWYFPCDLHGEYGNMVLKLTKNVRENDDARSWISAMNFPGKIVEIQDP